MFDEIQGSFGEVFSEWIICGTMRHSRQCPVNDTI